MIKEKIMAISPIGNVTYINQNSQINALQQANALTRADMTNIINKEFQDKINEVQEVRPAEDAQALNPDSQNNSKSEFNESEQHHAKKDEEDDKTTSSSSDYILDILA